jgi:hypothetical protein
MRNILLGIVAGLLLGTMGAVGYGYFLGDGNLPTDLQAKLDAAKASLAKSDQDKKDLASEVASLTEQVNQLQKSNSDLKHQDDAEPATSAPTARTQPPPPDMGPLAGAMRGIFRGGGFQNPQQRMVLFKARLRLSPEQSAKIQAALDADSKARGDLMRQAFQNGGKVDPVAAAKANTLDKVLADVLNPEQQRQYQQLQTDEKVARADTMVTSQINSFAPLLQLTDAQRQQVYDSLYQTQMAAPDPMSLIGNPNAVATLTAQAQATNAALQKNLTSDQWALYQQQTQALGGQGRRGGNGNTAGGTNTTTAATANGAGANNGYYTTQPGASSNGAGAATGSVVVSNAAVPAAAANASSSVTTSTVSNPASPAASVATATNPAPADPATTNAAASNSAATTNAPSSASTNAAPPQ